jgi:hypothetical protein
MLKASQHFTATNRRAYLASQRERAIRRRADAISAAVHVALAAIALLIAGGLAAFLPAAYASGDYPTPALAALATACVAAYMLATLLACQASNAMRAYTARR